VYYATRFISGTLDTSFIRHKRSVAKRVFNKRVLEELDTILFYDQMDNTNTGVPELAPQRKQTNADNNLDSKNANEEQLMACIREL
jgi:hypothetical protein